MTSTPSKRGTIPGIPRSSDAVEADIRAALNGTSRPSTGEDVESADDEPRGRHVHAGHDELGGLDAEQRRERLARMLHSKIGLDPLTAPLSMVEEYDAAPPPPPPAVELPADSSDEPDPEPPPEADDAPMAGPELVDESAPLKDTTPASPPAPGAESIDVFAALREDDLSPDAGPSTDDGARFTPTGHDADSVVLSPLHERLGTRPQAPAGSPPLPEEPMKRKTPTGPEASPIAQLSAMFEDHWDTEDVEHADEEGPGLDAGRRPTCSTDGPDTVEGGQPSGGPQATGDPRPRVEFAPRRGTQRVLLVLLLVAFAGLCLTGWGAWQDPTTTTIAVAAFFGVVTLVLWTAHSRAVPPKVVVEHGVLTVTRHESRNIFDLKSSYTPVEAVGTPGRRGWKVLITRRSMDPFVIDDSMVDPHEFTRVLEHYRPTAAD